MAKTVFLLNAQAVPPPVKGGVFHLDVVTISLNKMIILPSVGKNADSLALLVITHKVCALRLVNKTENHGQDDAIKPYLPARLAGAHAIADIQRGKRGRSPWR